MNASAVSRFLFGGASFFGAVACAQGSTLDEVELGLISAPSTQGTATGTAGGASVTAIAPSDGPTVPTQMGSPAAGESAGAGGRVSMVPPSIAAMGVVPEMADDANLTVAEAPPDTEDPDEEDDTPGGGTTPAGGGTTPAGGGDGATVAGFDLVLAAYAYDDGTSTATVEVSDGSVCLSGTAVDAGSDFANWGAGLGLQLAADEGAVPFDAEAAGISSITFTITGDIGSALRVGVNTVSEENAAIGRGLTSDDLTMTGTYTVEFSSLYQPNWDTNTSGAALDQTDIDSVQFQTTSVQGSSTSFDFCIEDVTFD